MNLAVINLTDINLAVMHQTSALEINLVQLYFVRKQIGGEIYNSATAFSRLLNLK